MKPFHLRHQTATNQTTMKRKRKSENLCFSVCDVILCYLTVVISLNIVVDGVMANDNQKILSRRRRYLIFPEGSSFQVVYETYHPVVDYPNLLIFYLTQALAWELPYEAFHPEEHLQDLLDDVVFPQEDQYDDISANNGIQNVNQYQQQDQENGIGQINLQNQGNGNRINSQNLLQNINQNQQGLQFQNRNEVLNSKNSSRVTNAYYYSNNNSTRAPNQYYYPNYQNPTKVSGLIEPITNVISNKMDYYFSYADKVLSQIANYATQKHTPWRKTDWSTYTKSQPSYQQQQANRRYYAQRQSRNFIHPVFGKRSTDKNVTPEEKFNLNFHRTSRQTMYKKIAKFLESGEINGSECVLKALCETGKRRDTDEKPGSFLMEIMRAIFSLPDAFDKEFHPLHSQYDQAHNALTDCENLFPKCKPSLWNKNLILQ